MRKLLDLLFPPRCVFCGKIVPPDEPRQTCRDCINTVPRTFGPVRGDDPVLAAAPFMYAGGVRRAVHRLKFRGKTSYAKPLALYMATEAIRSFPNLPDVVVWAPVSAGRLRQRGYDQSRLLAEETAALLGLPLADALEKTRETPPQSTLTDKTERRRNARGAYVCRDPEAVHGKSVLLIDDVRTSGATLHECAVALTAAGAETVYGLTLAAAGK